MTLRTFDRAGRVLVLAAFLFSTLVALFNWEWFPEVGDWGHIARIPPTGLNYLALLAPLVLLLVYLLIRRIWLKKPF